MPLTTMDLPVSPKTHSLQVADLQYSDQSRYGSRTSVLKVKTSVSVDLVQHSCRAASARGLLLNVMASLKNYSNCQQHPISFSLVSE